MIRRLIKVLAIALGIIFLPYFIGKSFYAINHIDEGIPIAIYWAMGCCMFGVLAILFILSYHLYKYIRYGN